MAMSLLVRMFVGALTVQAAAALASVSAKQQISLHGKAMSMTDPIAMLEDIENMAHSGQTVPAETAKTIKELVQSIRETLEDTHASAVTDTKNLQDASEACNVVLGNAKTGSIKEADDKIILDQSSHETCREAEKEIKQPECTKLTDFLGGVSSPGAFPADRAEQVLYIKGLKADAVCDPEDKVGDLDGKCKNEKSQLATKQGECNEKQIKFEASFCAKKVALDTACDAFDGCHETAADAFTAHVTAYTDLVAKWKVEFKSLAKIDCFCNVWGNTVDDKDSLTGGDGSVTAVKTCDELVVDTDTMNVNFDIKFAKVADACVRLTEYPEEACEDTVCASGFAATHYTGANAGLNVRYGCAVEDASGELVDKSNHSAALKAPAQLFELHADGSMHKDPTHTQSSLHKHGKHGSMIRREPKRHAQLDSQGRVAHVETPTANEAKTPYSSADLQSMEMGALMNLMKTLGASTKDVKAAMAKSILNVEV